MCELLEESLSDTDEEISHQNMSNAFLHIVTSYHIGTTLELCLTEEELERVGLSCHFAVDCLCDNWCPLSLATTNERLTGHPRAC